MAHTEALEVRVRNPQLGSMLPRDRLVLDASVAEDHPAVVQGERAVALLLELARQALLENHALVSGREALVRRVRARLTEAQYERALVRLGGIEHQLILGALGVEERGPHIHERLVRLCRREVHPEHAWIGEALLGAIRRQRAPGIGDQGRQRAERGRVGAEIRVDADRARAPHTVGLHCLAAHLVGDRRSAALLLIEGIEADVGIA